MASSVLLSFLLAMGLLMYIRGLIYALKPEGAMAKKRQKKNLKYGMNTDMAVFGKKVRRLGFIFMLIGGLILAYLQAGDAPANPKNTKKQIKNTEERTKTSDSATAASANE